MRQLVRVLLTLLSHYRRHLGQTLFLTVGLVTGVGLWSAVQIINDHARASYAEADHLLGAQASHWIRARDGSGIAPADYIALRRAGFTQIYPVLETRLTANDEPLWLIATDLLALPRAESPLGSGNGDWTTLIQPPFQAWYPPDLAADFGLAAGDSLALDDGRTLPPAAIQQQPQQGRRVFMDIGAALTVLQRDHFSYLGVAKIPDANALRQALPDNLQLVDNRQRLDLTQLTASLHSHLTAMSLLAFAVGLFIVFNAVRFALHLRRPTLHTLRELGASNRTLTLAVALEAVLWSLVGTLGGLVAGRALATLLLPPVAASLQSLYGAVVGADIQLGWQRLLFAWGITLVGLLLALAWPLWRESRQTLRQSRSTSDDWAADGKARWWLAGGGLILALAALILHSQLTSVTQGFVVLGLAVFAAAWVLPLWLALALQGAQRCLPERAWKLRWALRDAWAQLPQVRVAMMALLLALTANLGVETLVGSFRSALTAWLDQRLAADLYIQDDSLRLAQFTDNGTAPWLVASHQRNGVAIRWSGRPTLIRGLNTDAPDSRALPLADQNAHLNDWLAGHDGWLLANEQAHHLTGLQLGDAVELDTATGPAEFRVAGFFHDYGSPYFQFYLPYNVVAQHWPNAAPQGLALWLADMPAAEQQAESALLAAGAQPGDWLNQNTIKTVSLRIFERTFAITTAMNGLTLSVAGIALLAALLALHQQRLAQYAHWRALGLKHREWLLIVALPLALLVALTGLAALPLGALLSALLVHDLNVLAFGWTMPLRWQWAPAARLALLTFAVLGITLLISLWQVRRRLPQALKQLGEDDA
ncbi:ABC transporter permease [Saccharospirillum mangrovi]|uniref:ABC transporter permease n=1 Tax=Saccharospirillum mangrovi TaxID=2161747 RepID=UPI000D39667A|nr:ABC transporter permease [Saccharospirillum mangrovi]